MLGVEAVGILRDFDGERAGRIWERRTGDASAMELTPAGGEADLLGCAGGARLGRVQLRINEPDSLREESQEQSSSEKLGAAKAFTSEELGHKVGRSVLPSYSRCAGNFRDER
jgi:hypothetical protein